MFERFPFYFSLKDIPIPSRVTYLKDLLARTEDFICRLRWIAYHFLRDTDSDKKNNFGFRCPNSPPQIPELAGFEYKLYRTIEQLEFRDKISASQVKMCKTAKEINKSDDIFLLADKTRNIYKVSKENYKKLLTENITKDYKMVSEDIVNGINLEAKEIAEELEIADRVESYSESPAFITLKDHKQDYMNKPKCRLINPAKTNIGKISRQILQRINKEIRDKTQLKQWQSTKQVIDWFKKVDNKKNKSFIQLDVEEFYPSITEELLDKALVFAKEQTNITEEEIKIIKHSRKSLLYTRTKDNKPQPWIKKGRMKEKDQGSVTNDDEEAEDENLFDITMGAPDGAEACELVGLLILKEIKDNYKMLDFGLYRDDGLGCHTQMSGPKLEKLKKDLIKTFKTQFGLRITIETGMKTVDFLDITMNLEKNTYQPYKKPNDNLKYVSFCSNHPVKVLKQVPIGINKRLRAISCNKKEFEKVKPLYQKALYDSGHDYTLCYEEKKKKLRRKSKRKITYYNPPFNLELKTKIGQKFLEIISEEFTKDNPLYKIFNRNTLKISYSCEKNFKNIIQSHNMKISQQMTTKINNNKECNCRKNTNCPLDGNCNVSNVIYKATTEEHPPKFYIGSTENFKLRYNNHKCSFRNASKKSSTTLSSHVWEKQLGTNPRINWDILKCTIPYQKGMRNCDLCLTEKFFILKDISNRSCLNKRHEMLTKCRHKDKFYLSAIK